MRRKDKVAIVTGSSSGLALATATLCDCVLAGITSVFWLAMRGSVSSTMGFTPLDIPRASIGSVAESGTLARRL